MTTSLDPAPLDPTPSAPDSGRAPSRTGLFRAVWRWHFFASFLVVPVLLLLATTGLIYLFRFQLEPLMHADLMRVDVPEDAQAALTTKTPTTQLEAVREAFPDATIVSVTEPGAPDETTRFSITTAEGAGRDVYVDPYDGTVLGSLDPDTTLSGYAVRLHGELMAGRLGDAVIEFVACWAVVMALTGYYLYWRGRTARRRQRTAGRRGAQLRSRHASIGLVAGVGLLYLLVSGLPWTGVWGERVQTLATDNGTSMWSLSRVRCPTRPPASTSPCHTATRATCPGRWASRRSPCRTRAVTRVRWRTSTPRSPWPTVKDCVTRSPSRCRRRSRTSRVSTR